MRAGKERKMPVKEIIIALPRFEDGKKIRDILQKNGLRAGAVCTSGASILQEIDFGAEGGIVITTVRLSDMHVTELADCLPGSYEILLLGKPGTLAQESLMHILSLEMPLRSFELVNTVYMMLGDEPYGKQRQQRKKQRSHRDRQTLDEAKQLLMERNHLSEEEAYRYIQKTSMDSGRSMVQTAQMILLLMDDI